MTNDERGQVPPEDATGRPHEPQDEAGWGQARTEVPLPPTTQQQPQQQPLPQPPSAQPPSAQPPSAHQPAWGQHAAQAPAPVHHATAPQSTWQQPASTPMMTGGAAGGQGGGTPWATYPAASAPQPRRRRRPVAVLALVGLLGGTVLGGAAGATAATLVAQGGTSPTSSVSDVTITGASSTDPQTIADVADTASQSVVTVQVSSQAGSGTGSGVVVADGGIIVTNNHVVTLDGTAADAQITVQTTDGQLLAATVVGTDPTVDLAVLRVDADLPVVAFADSDAVSVGDTAIAIGSPLGLSTTVTDGIVSAVDRGLQISSSATEEDSAQSQQSPFGFWSQQGAQAAQETVSIPVVQTDASINPGNSGGALLNAAGQLIGVNVAIASMSDDSSTGGSIGIGFAIEASLVQRVVDEIVANGEATHGLLGASVSDVTDASIGHTGAQLADVVADGAAAQAGLQSGDVVTAVDGTAVTSATDLTAQVRAAAGGADVTLTILRAGSEQDVDVTLGTL
ncbi:S1C family serine protease [Agrococcus versicolor]